MASLAVLRRLAVPAVRGPTTGFARLFSAKAPGPVEAKLRAADHTPTKLAVEDVTPAAPAGASAPAGDVYKHFGITVDAVVSAAESRIA